jgi:hypothetical protein
MSQIPPGLLEYFQAERDGNTDSVSAQPSNNLADPPSASSSLPSPRPLLDPIPVTAGSVRAQNKQTPDPSQQLVTRLAVLLTPKNMKGALAGAPTTRTDLRAAQRRVNRSDGTSGICKKTGELFSAIISQLNAGLVEETGFQHLVTLEEVLKHMPKGAQLRLAATQNVQTAVKAIAAGEMVALSKRATKGTLAGILAQPTLLGQLSTAEVSEMTGMSKSHVKQNRKKVAEGLGDAGQFEQGAEWKPPGLSRE